MRTNLVERAALAIVTLKRAEYRGEGPLRLVRLRASERLARARCTAAEWQEACVAASIRLSEAEDVRL